jgi:hypothetical protein
VQAYPEGKDLGDLGKGKILAEPRMMAREGTECRFLAGDEVAVPGGDRDKVEFIETGPCVRATVRGQPDGTLRVDAVLERSDSVETDEAGVRVWTRSVRAVRRVRLGQAVKLAEKDDRGKPRYLAVVRVASEEDVLTRSRSAQAEPAEKDPARVGQIFIIGNENVKQDVILRQVPLFPGQVLTYPALRDAERNLEKTGLFGVDPENGIRPTVRVVDSGDGSGFKDIIITVEEKPGAGQPSER